MQPLPQEPVEETKANPKSLTIVIHEHGAMINGGEGLDGYEVSTNLAIVCSEIIKRSIKQTPESRVRAAQSFVKRFLAIYAKEDDKL